MTARIYSILGKSGAHRAPGHGRQPASARGMQSGSNTQPRGGGTTSTYCAAPTGLVRMEIQNHGLTPVARIVSPLRGLKRNVQTAGALIERPLQLRPVNLF